MRALILVLAGLVLGFGTVSAASAQARGEVQIEAGTDTAGAAPACLLTVRFRNAGERRITVFVADMEAVDATGGTPLRLNQPQLPFSGIEPGETRDWTTAAIAGVRCDRVRLRVTRVTWSPRCQDAAWRAPGLAAFEAPAR